jgi:Uma2 family endonuclease
MTTIPDTAAMVVRASHVPGPPQGGWTYEDYAKLGDLDGYRYEIIDGVLYMAPAPIPEHERVAMLIGARLVAAVEDTGLGQVFGSPDIDIGPTTVRPDAAVVLNEHADIIAENRLIGPPDLVVEIASPSTAAYDRDPDEGKRGAYARIGVPEYWIADPLDRSIEVLALEGDHYRSLGVYQGDERLISRLLPGISSPTRRFFPREA